jgi:DNA-binding transcriptional regulator YdaS (Cro superfamily)
MIQEIQRMKAMGLGKKTIAKALGISKNTVKQYWELTQVTQVSGTNVASIEAIVSASRAKYEAPWSKEVNWETVKKAVDAGESLSVWLEEWQQDGLTEGLRGVPYTSFWREFKRRYPEAPLEFHKYHPPGERIEIDHKGERSGFGYYDARSGQFILCEMFGAVLCFSQLLYIEASPSQRKADFLSSIHRAFAFFGGVTALLTGDNLKSAVTRSHRYDPDLNPDFSSFCSHYAIAPVPARPRKPKDKNLIEGALGLFWRWIRVKLKQRRFYSLDELNRFVREMLEKFNNRVQRKYGMSRRQKFESAERALLKALPQTAYEICEWSTAKIHWDCFGQVGKNFYSAPFALRGKELSVRITATHIEYYYQLERVAIHRRMPANQQGRYIRQDEHLPPAHKAMLEMVPQRCLQDAVAVGPETGRLVEHLITKSPHPLMYLRRVLGILRLKSRHSPLALEQACRTVNSLPEVFPKMSTVEGVLKAQASRSTSGSEVPQVKRQDNPNLRGQAHWMQPVE